MASSGKLSGRVILVLENDYLLADDERCALEAEGARVLGPFGHSGKAIEAVGKARPDCALVDINLGGEPDFAPARELLARGIPILFVTGYDTVAIPADLASAPCLQKPVTDEGLVAAMASLIALGSER